jgi:hypothetical protein
VLLLPGKTVPYSRVKSLLEKLVADRSLRERHRKELEFPLESHYSNWPSFSEEDHIARQ